MNLSSHSVALKPHAANCNKLTLH
uniref:Uncharacterized protein n=1 Tax=Anguilla anguilla TaxID=7936 RepID=A0A0E9R8D8_ANGAN